MAIAALTASLLAAGLAACASLPQMPAIPGFGKRPAATEQPPVQLGTINPGVIGYLPRTSYPDGVVILGPPPGKDSPQGIADQAIFDQTRSQEGSSRWVQAARDDELSGSEAFKSLACAAGLTINSQTMPRTTTLLLRAGSDVHHVAAVPKVAFKRLRPPIGNDKPICVPRADWLKTNGSYPSGHSMVGWTWGLIVAELVPEKGSAVLARGREFGDSRVVCGVHFQSDVEAGRTLGAALSTRLHADPAFEADLKAARREVAKFRASGVAADCSGV